MVGARGAKSGELKWGRGSTARGPWHEEMAAWHEGTRCEEEGIGGGEKRIWLK